MAKYEFPLFYDYTQMLLEWFRKTLGVSRYGKDKIYIQYMTPDRAFAKFISPTVNGQPNMPVVTFNLGSMEYLPSENPGAWIRERKWDYKDGRHKDKAPLLVYRLVYNVNLYTSKSDTADNILFQVLSSAPKNRKAVEIVNNHWAEFQCTDPRNETNLEPGEYQDKIIRFGFDILIPRAYIPRSVPASFPARPIKSISTEVENITGDTLLGPLLTEVTVPDPPRNFIITGTAERDSLILKWDAPKFDGKDDILGYRIQESNENVLFTDLEELHTGTSYIHRNLNEGDTKYYRIFAVNREGESEFIEGFGTP